MFLDLTNGERKQNVLVLDIYAWKQLSEAATA